MTFDEWWGAGRYGWTDESAGTVKELARAAWNAGVFEGKKEGERAVSLHRATMEIWKLAHAAKPGFQYNGP